MTGNWPQSVPGECCATSTAPTAPSRSLRFVGSPTPTAASTAPKLPPRWPSVAVSRPGSATTSTTAGSTRATTRPPPIRPSAWSADRAAGLESLLIASTNDQVRELNLRAQAFRLAVSEIPTQRQVTLADGTTVSAGDVIITRRNDRRLTLSATDWVANG